MRNPKELSVFSMADDLALEVYRVTRGMELEYQLSLARRLNMGIDDQVRSAEAKALLLCKALNRFVMTFRTQPPNHPTTSDSEFIP